MTMVPSQNLITSTTNEQQQQQQQQTLQYQRRLLLLLQRGDEINNCQEEEENMSQTAGNNNNNNNNHHEYCSAESDVVNNIAPTMTDSRNDNQLSSEAAASSNSKADEADDDDVEGSWLQLSIGGPALKASPRPAGGDIMFRGSGIINNNNTTSLMYNYEQYAGSSSSQNYYPPDQPLNWANFTSSSPSSFFNVPRQFHLHPPPPTLLRVVDPPRRPHSGIWFALRPSQNQTKEPFLPQISKSFLRIKDGRMTVRLVIKYLVNKLRLESESEIEITCRGQQLAPLMTLQQVRDNIWAPNLSLLQDSSTTDHLMLLLYSRSA